MSDVVGVDRGAESPRAGFCDATGRRLAAASHPRDTQSSPGVQSEHDLGGSVPGARPRGARNGEPLGPPSREPVGHSTRRDLLLARHGGLGRAPGRHLDGRSDAAPLCAAVLAEVGLGTFATIDEGIAAVTRPGRVVEPRAAERSLRDEIHGRYLALRPALKPSRPAALQTARTPC